MKKAVLLSSPISRQIALFGHGDSLCVSDAGLPIPKGSERIDLAVCAGMPPFLETLSAITSELFVERALVAEELRLHQPEFHQRLLEIIERLASEQGNTIPVEEVKHEEFKRLTENCKAVIRTGECTPYANVILFSGVVF